MTSKQAKPPRKVKEAGYSPIDRLRPFQRKIVLDPARFKIVSCARQCGKSTMFACEATLDCCKHDGANWLCVSAGMRQAGEWLEKARDWAKIWTKSYASKGVPISIANISKSELRFSNGSRVIALPANPDTIRGYTANVILDEFAYHEHADRVWQAIVPSITSEEREKLKVRIGSTVAGKNNQFWKLLDGAKNTAGWSSYTINVEQAKADGLKIDVEALRASITDPDIWAQEYMCQPVDATQALLTYDDIASCESSEAGEYFDDIAMDEAGKRFAIGMDIGRQHDLTVIWVVEIGVNDKLITRQVQVLDHMQLDDQQRILFTKLRRRGVEHCTIDSTGIGYQLAENASREFGSMVTQYAFTEQSKRELFFKMQTAFQRKQIAIPESDKIREDLHSMQRLFTSSGKVLFSAPSNADGHADRATACALAIDAASRGKVRAMSCSPRPNGWYSIPSDDDALPTLEQMMNPEYL